MNPAGQHDNCNADSSDYFSQDRQCIFSTNTTKGAFTYDITITATAPNGLTQTTATPYSLVYSVYPDFQGCVAIRTIPGANPETVRCFVEWQPLENVTPFGELMNNGLFVSPAVDAVASPFYNNMYEFDFPISTYGAGATFSTGGRFFPKFGNWLDNSSSEYSICLENNWVLRGVGSWRNEGIVDLSSNTYRVDFSQLSSGLTMTRPITQEIVRSTKFTYDGIRIALDGFFQIYKYYEDYGEIAINLSWKGGFNSVFLNNGYLSVTEEMDECNSGSVNSYTNIYSATSFSDGACNANVNNNGKNYNIPGKLTIVPYRSEGVMVAVNTSSCSSNNILNNDFHARKWVAEYNENCWLQTGEISSFGSNNLLGPEKLCVFDTPCIHGYLGGIRFDGPLDNNKQLIGQFPNMYECAQKALEINSAFAAVMGNPYKSNPPYNCYAIDTPSDYATVNVIQDSAYMTCYLKDRGVCPANDYAPESPGAWMKGVEPASAGMPWYKIPISHRGHCVKKLFEVYGHFLLGYSAHKDNDGNILCIPWRDKDYVQFVSPIRPDVETCLFDSKPFF